MQLNDSIAAVVSGGGSGLGEGTARALAACGVRVGILDINDAAGQVAQDIDGVSVSCDVSDAESVRRALSELRSHLGQERVLVNCAGIAPAVKTVDREGQPHDAELFAKVIAVNLIGTFNLCSQAAAGMCAADPITEDGERGVLINTASVAAYDGQIGQTAYGSSKAAVAGMTLPMARDLARSGIRVMTIAPGIFGTPMVSGMPDKVQDALAASIPFPSRLGRADEYAKLVISICENAMLNGETIRLDGAIRMAPR